jgi:hypothetical protein
MATTPKAPTTTATKVAIGTGVVALFGGLLAALGSGSKKASLAKPLGKCGACGR